MGDPSHRAYTLPKPAKVRDDGVKVDIATTGATGYIGKHLVPHLLDAGYTVRSLTLPGTAKDIDPHPNHEVIEGFLEDDAVLDKLVDGAEKVLHMAARLGGSCAVEPLRETNVHGTHQLLRACNRSNVLKRFIFSSSVAAYQNQFNEKEWPIHESHPVRVDGGQDLADYGMTKVAGENLLRFYGRKHGYEHSILRFALVYGIGDPLVDLMVREQASNDDFGQGQGSEQPRQFVHIDDAVESILRACFQDAAANETFNVAGPDVITYHDIGRMTRIAVGKPKRKTWTPTASACGAGINSNTTFPKVRNTWAFARPSPLPRGCARSSKRCRTKASFRGPRRTRLWYLRPPMLCWRPSLGTERPKTRTILNNPFRHEFE